MRSTLRAVHRSLRVVLVAAAVLAGVAAGPALTSPQVALADDEAPVRVGTLLVARGDFELQKVVITRGAKVEVTALPASNSVDVALPDGAVLHRVPMARIRYFFDVVR